jgi:DNA-binding IclR family transcriptional regulator
MDVKQAANVLRLIEYFSSRLDVASLADIAKHFSWPRSSTFNLLATLSSQGYLYEPHGRGRYYPSPKWMSLLRQIEAAQPLPPHLSALLQNLAGQTGETAVLAATSGQHAIFIAVVESDQAVRYTANVGKLVPIHVTATGRALLSQLSAEECAAVLRKANFERYTKATLMSADTIEQQIALSLKRGWFEGSGEFTGDLGGVACPLTRSQRHLAVMVGGPMQRIRPRYAQIAKLIHAEINRLPQEVT